MKKGAVRKFFRNINWATFFLSLVTVYGTALLGGIFTSKGVNSFWYLTVRPSITPPNWVFPVVWNILFLMIFISLYLCLSKLKSKKDSPKFEIAFGINLILNFLWSFFYFWLRNPLLAFVDSILLLISIASLILIIWKHCRLSAILLIPYLLWISFALVLTYLSAFG